MKIQRFRLPDAYTGIHRVVAEEIDEYEHVNNTVYLQWLDRIAWAHSAKLGVSLEECLAIRCGMAVRHTRADYLEAARLDDLLMIGTVDATYGPRRGSTASAVVCASTNPVSNFA